jgi:hypothetical protein
MYDYNKYNKYNKMKDELKKIGAFQLKDYMRGWIDNYTELRNLEKENAIPGLQNINIEIISTTLFCLSI